MTKNEMREKGFIVLEKIHIIIFLIAFIFTMGAAIGVAQFQISRHEERIKCLEENDIMLIEIKINLKALMEKQGIKYQEAKIGR